MILKQNILILRQFYEILCRKNFFQTPRVFFLSTSPPIGGENFVERKKTLERGVSREQKNKFFANRVSAICDVFVISQVDFCKNIIVHEEKTCIFDACHSLLLQHIRTSIGRKKSGRELATKNQGELDRFGCVSNIFVCRTAQSNDERTTVLHHRHGR